MTAKMFFSDDPCEQFKFEMGGERKCRPALLETFKDNDLPNLVSCMVAIRETNKWATKVYEKLRGVGLGARREILKTLELCASLLDQSIENADQDDPALLRVKKELHKLLDGLNIIGGRGGPKQQIPVPFYYVPLRLKDRYALSDTRALRVTQSIMSLVGYYPIPKGRRYNERLLAKLRIGIRVNRQVITQAMRASGK